ncbi:RNA-binding ribosome biosynthesis protein mak21 [Spiromyces aspiralis]|uniref:RNA-binding ribosome biosynthesis protein mak21 n=1 Tax=Spiromyces aspiralis TaxID=68401 RepID=A0ACC1I0Y2_9FUNG|nr:RNA-binding ribosome biosynthesis protein mak21 [Spiromyces aspiralis]
MLNFNLVIQALALLYQLSQKHTTIINHYHRALYGSLLDPRIETTSKQAVYLNLLFKSLKFEPNPSDELAKLSADTKEGTETPATRAKDCEAYDSAKRDPRFAQAEHSCCWELSVLLNHFHPSVERLVRKLLDHEAINEAPNLHLHSLSHFLERFVYRNSKMKEDPQCRDQSLTQSLIDTKGAQQATISKKPVGLSESKRFNPEKLASMSVEEIPEDVQFFHKFFQMKRDKDLFDKNKGKKKYGKKTKGDDSEGEDIDAMVDKNAMAEDSMGFAAALMGRNDSKKRRKRDKLPIITSFEDYEHIINNDEGLT